MVRKGAEMCFFGFSNGQLSTPPFSLVWHHPEKKITPSASPLSTLTPHHYHLLKEGKKDQKEKSEKKY